MSLVMTPCYQVAPGTCYVHGILGRSNPSCVASQGLVYLASPTLTAITRYTRHSPAVTILPLDGISSLPSSFSVVNFQNTSDYDPSSPAIPALLLITPSITPLLALGSSLFCGKINYDVSEDPGNARVSMFYGKSTPITREQKRSLVVEGTLHRRFRIVFDHPALTRTVEFQKAPTVGDLLAELHWHFYDRVGPGEMYDLKKDMDHYSMAIRTQKKRCNATFDPDVEWNRGMKRVDILGKESKFRGIYLDSSSTSSYLTLHVVFGK